MCVCVTVSVCVPMSGTYVRTYICVCVCVCVCVPVCERIDGVCVPVCERIDGVCIYVCVRASIEVSTAAKAPSPNEGQTLLHMLAQSTWTKFSQSEYEEYKAFSGFRPKNNCFLILTHISKGMPDTYLI